MAVPHNHYCSCFKSSEMKYITSLFFLILAMSSQGQDGYKFFEFTDTNNDMKDFAVIRDSLLLVISKHYTPYDTSGYFYENDRLYLFDMDFELQQTVVMDSVISFYRNPLLLEEDRVVIPFYPFPGDDFGVSRIIKVFNYDLEQIDEKEVPFAEDKWGPYNGMVKVIDDYYMYGDVLDSNWRAQGRIIKLNNDFDILWNKWYKYDNIQTKIIYMDNIFDNALEFSMDYSTGAGPGIHGRVFNRIDTSGNIIASSDFNNKDYFQMWSINGHFMTFKNGDLLIKINAKFRTPGDKVLLKYNLEKDTAQWETVLLGREGAEPWVFNLDNPIETKNGDILVYGDIITASPKRSLFSNTGEFTERDINSYIHNAAIVKLNKDGEILWRRLYMIPNTHPLLPVEEFGDYTVGYTKKLIEKEDKSLLFGGNAYYNTKQFGKLLQEKVATSRMWLMNLDENGCVKGEECEEIIIMDGEYRPYDYDKLIRPGNVWSVAEYYPDGRIRNVQYSIEKDPRNLNTPAIFYELWKSEGGATWEKTDEYYFRSGTKIFRHQGYKEAHYNGFAIYDFLLEAGDTFKTMIPETFEEVEFIVTEMDSVELLDGKIRKRMTLTDLSNPAEENNLVWIDGVGSLNGIRGLQDYNDRAVERKLLCFHRNGELIYQNAEIGACRVKGTDVESSMLQELIVYPNPTSDKILIAGIEGPLNYTIYSVDGKRLLSGNISDKYIDVSSLDHGMYFLRIEIDGQHRTVKLVKASGK